MSADYIREHPEFAKSVAGVIAFWAHSDGNLAAILSFMLKTDIRTGVAMYQSLISAEAKRSALLAAAENALEEWEAVLLQAVLKANRASRNQRNDFAHGIWGISPEIKDALLLMDSSVVMDRNVSHRQAETDAEGRRIIRPRGLDNSKIMVYRKNDFHDALRAAESAYVRLVNYYYLAGYKDERARRALLSDRLVSQAASKLSREKTSQVRAHLRRPGDGEAPPEGYRNHPAVDLPE